MNTEYIKARDVAAKYNANVLDPVEHNNAISIQRFLGFIAGADWGRAYESPAVKAMRDALKRECCCPGETSWTTGDEILCDACEAVAAYDRATRGTTFNFNGDPLDAPLSVNVKDHERRR